MIGPWSDKNWVQIESFASGNVFKVGQVFENILCKDSAAKKKIHLASLVTILAFRSGQVWKLDRLAPWLVDDNLARRAPPADLHGQGRHCCLSGDCALAGSVINHNDGIRKGGDDGYDNEGGEYVGDDDDDGDDTGYKK